jgi:hypothetical protein
MRGGADLSIVLLVCAAIAVWSGIRASNVRELCHRAIVFCGILSTIPVIGLVIARLRDTGYISRRVFAGILATYTMGLVATGIFVVLGLAARVTYGAVVQRHGARR